MAMDSTEDLIAALGLTPVALEACVTEVLRQRLMRQLSAMLAGELRRLLEKQKEKSVIVHTGITPDSPHIKGDRYVPVRDENGEIVLAPGERVEVIRSPTPAHSRS